MSFGDLWCGILVTFTWRSFAAAGAVKLCDRSDSKSSKWNQPVRESWRLTQRQSIDGVCATSADMGLIPSIVLINCMNCEKNQHLVKRCEHY